MNCSNRVGPNGREINGSKLSLRKGPLTRGLKPYALKGARTVSRGGSFSNGTFLLGMGHQVNIRCKKDIYYVVKPIIKK